MRIIYTSLLSIWMLIGWGQTAELIIPLGHTDIISSVEFSSDGKHIFTTSHDQTIKVWETNSGKLIKTLKEHTHGVRSINFSHDRKLAACESWDLSTSVWNTQSGELLYKLKNQKKPIFNPNGNDFLTVGDNNTIYLWNQQTGNLIKAFSGHQNEINSLSFHPKDHQFISTSSDHTSIIWNIETGQPSQRFWSGSKVISGIYNADGDKIYITNFDSIRIIETASGKTKESLVLNPTNNKTKPKFESSYLSPDGKSLVGVAYELAPYVWNAQSGEGLFSLVGHTSAITSVEFSPESKFIVTTSWDNTIRIWESATGQLLKTLQSPISGITHFAKFHPDGQHVFVACGSSLLESIRESRGYVWNVSTGQIIIELNSKTELVSYANFNTNETLLIKATGNKAMVFNMSTGKIQCTLTGHSDKILSCSFTTDGKKIITSSRDKTIKIWNHSGELLKTLTGHQEHVAHLNISSDNQYLLTTDYLSSRLWDLKSFTLLNTFVGHKTKKGIDFSRELFEKHQSKFNETGSIIINATEKEANTWDTRTGNRLHTFKGHINTIIGSDLSPDGELAITVSLDGTAKVWSISTGKLKHTLPMSPFAVNYAEFSPLGRTVVVEEEKTSKLWDAFTGQLLFTFSGISPRFSDDGQTLITAETIGIINTWSVSTGKLLSTKNSKGSLLTTNSTLSKVVTTTNSEIILSDLTTVDRTISIVTTDNDWVVTHPSGLFDASPGAMDKLYFVQGLDIVDFNQLKDRYYEPGLWKKVMGGEPLRNVVGMKSIDLPPDIQVGQVDGEGYLNINLTNRGGGIGEVNLFVNGKEVIKDARDANVKPDAPNASIKVFVGKHKSIIKGQENIIAVKAWNKDHWVQSRGQVLSYHSKEIEQYKPAVHILTCGVSDYTGNEIDLKYAAKDATDMSLALQLGAKKLFGAERSYVYNLTTAQAHQSYPTKTNILKAFEKISATAHPLDVFVMYVSGHGINYGGQDGDWHYLTQEAYTSSASAYNDPAIRAQTTISSNELVELFKKVPALKQVLMLDACASGKVVDNLIAQKDIESSTLRALDRMRDRTGMHIITGCTADAVSYEASKYGQGVLTYSLLEGIRGAALRDEQYVDVNKLFQYAQDRVPKLAEGIGGIQSPQVFSPQGAQSFDIGLLGDVEKKEIPIAKIRPVYIRSNFQDEDELEDVLRLSKTVDESLNEVSSKGVDAALIFVDVREYPDACKLIGRYKKIGNKIVLKLRTRCGNEDKTIELEGNDVESLKAAILQSIR